MKEWTTPDFRNTPSTTNLEKEEIVDALGNDANASMPEQVNRPNQWRKMMMMMMMMTMVMMMMKFVLDEKKEALLLRPGRYFHDETEHEGDEDSTDTRKNKTL